MGHGRGGRFFLAAVALALLAPGTAVAYQTYSMNRDATNCRRCHGQFGGISYISKVDGSAWRATLHDGHQAMVYDSATRGCRACHRYDYWPVNIKSSVAAAPFNTGCLSCHGRSEAPGLRGYGLMQRHHRRGIVSCATCHPEADPANYTPVAESVQPPGYFTPDPARAGKPTDACNRSGAENRVGSARGLDNDGDLLDDLADPDCGGTALDTSITGMPGNPSGSGAASFSFTASEAGATFECGLDGAAFAPCTSPAGYSGLGDGSHVFSVRARDAAGNVDPTPASYSWVVDTVAPDTSITGMPGNPSGSGAASFSFTAGEAGATFECGLDGAAFAPCTSPAGYSGLGDGSHVFSVRARDAAGNVDPTPASYSWVVDTGFTRHELVVSADGVGDFSTIQGALDAITDARDDNRFRITVKPGIYRENVTVKPFVHLVGSGRDTTVIVAVAAAAAVTLADRTSIERLSVRSDVTGGFALVQALDGATASVRDVEVTLADVQAGVSAGPGTSVEVAGTRVVFEPGFARPRSGISAGGSSLLVTNSSIEARAQSPGSWVTGMMLRTTGRSRVEFTSLVVEGDGVGIDADGDVDLSHLSIEIDGGPVAMFVERLGIRAAGGVRIRHTDVVVSGEATTETTGILVSGGDVALEQTSVRSVAVTCPSHGVRVQGSVTISGGVVSGVATGLEKTGPADSFRIGGSRIEGGHNGVPGIDKVVNCVDQGFEPIPDL